MPRSFLALLLLIGTVPGCVVLSSLPVRVEEPADADESVAVESIDRERAHRIVEEILLREGFELQEAGPDEPWREYWRGEWREDRWISMLVTPTERGLLIELVEHGRYPSADARRLAETLRVALSVEFGEDRVSW